MARLQRRQFVFRVFRVEVQILTCIKRNNFAVTVTGETAVLVIVLLFEMLPRVDVFRDWCRVGSRYSSNGAGRCVGVTTVLTDYRCRFSRLEGFCVTTLQRYYCNVATACDEVLYAFNVSSPTPIESCSQIPPTVDLF